MPETSFRGLSTRTARSVRRSTWVLKCVPAVARMLWADRDRVTPGRALSHPSASNHVITPGWGNCEGHHIPGQIQRFNISQSPHAREPRLMLAPNLMGHSGQPKPASPGRPHRCSPWARIAPMMYNQHCRHSAHHSCVGLNPLPSRGHMDQTWCPRDGGHSPDGPPCSPGSTSSHQLLWLLPHKELPQSPTSGIAEKEARTSRAFKNL